MPFEMVIVSHGTTYDCNQENPVFQWVISEKQKPLIFKDFPEEEKTADLGGTI